ncbi:MAG: hydrogenase expression/formation protein HypE [Desulfobulbaceae bacterium]|nr:MAG: hydrogenase expression/formation protein HypE [Desulfobulbaceae bacterium]
MKDEITGFPRPRQGPAAISLAHGAGGKLSARLIEEYLLPRFANQHLKRLEDQATLAISTGRIAFSTDSYVVAPIFFPGGDIGELAVNGTVNDIAMAGARPLYLSLALIIEEGLPFTDLERILDSVQKAARQAGVAIVTGDTKVVERGSCDKIFINTSGIGILAEDICLGAEQIRAGDKIIVSGSLADHGMTILTSRHRLALENSLQSDTAPLADLVQTMLAAAPNLHALRDPTRGGVAMTLNEFAGQSKLGMVLHEESLPIHDTVRSACEILGIDPLYVANEGKLLAMVPAAEADALLRAMRDHPQGREAAIIGEVSTQHAGLVTMITALGASRVVDMPVADQLPRIC